MEIFAALFVVIATFLFGVFLQRIKDFLLEINVLGTLLRQLSGCLGETREKTETGEEAEPLTPLSPSPGSSGFEFEVFLSFRGEDTRKGFTRHLYDDLELRGISTFIDSEKLEKGEEINKLFEYIEMSKICVPIFSQRYAESKWCLKEITKSVELGKEMVPVFFGVEPSDVRNQNGCFKSAFKKHESNKKQDQEEVRKWKEALKKVGNLSGFNMKDMNWDEAKLRRAIVKRVLSKVNKKPLEVARHPIGIETRVQDVKKMLESGGNDHHVHVVGIHGMGGLGKTTIAKAVFNDLAEGFNGATCFLSNIREKSGQPNGLVALQKQVFREIFKDGNLFLSDVAHGVSLIKQRASRKRVLLILDDVDSVEQIDALAGGRDWFGAGSVIIITTRDEKVLQARRVKQHEIYKPRELNEAQSRELFMNHAFNSEQPEGEYLRLSKEVVAAAGGLPLTLEVLGSLLTFDMDVQEWKDTLQKLKMIPPSKVQQRLKLSYDGLDELEKEIFLDISCFFIGRDRENATYMWMDRSCFPNLAIKVLVQRSLIKIDKESQEFEMHDQIRDMGRAIVEEECSRKLHKKSRLWNSQETMSFLQKKVRRPIDAQGILIWPNVERFFQKCISAQWFEEMPNLRYLYAADVNFQGTYQHFPIDLKWLQLNNCFFDLPPSDFNLEDVVILDLYETNMVQILINQLPLRGMAFKKLKVLSIHGADIQFIPDFTDMSCLVKLTLENCPMLITIDESIGKLKKLTYLCIGKCEILEKLPDSISQLSSLEVLHISSCSKISSLPEGLEDLESLKKLKIDKASINVIPESVGGLTKLSELSVVDCTHCNVLPDSICQLSSLQVLNLEDCSGLGSLPEQLGDMGSLRQLHLSSTSIVKIPDSIGQLINLHELLMLHCEKLSRLPDTIFRLSSLEILNLGFCSSLACLPEHLGGMRSLRELHLDGTIIDKIPDSIGQLTNLCEIHMTWCQRLSMLPDSVCQLSNLEVLDLQRCMKLSSVPERLGEMKSLKKLDLSRTCIETIPNSIGQLINLHRLSVQYLECLRELPNSICQLCSLQYLNLQGCADLWSLPERLGDMDKLKYLILDDTRIQALPDSVGRLKNLQLLSLEGCKLLKALPNSIGRLSSLRALKISGTSLKGCENDISHLATINELTCSSFELLGLCKKLCKALKRLRLIDVVIKELPDFVGEMENLEELLLECEMLRALPNWISLCFKKLTRLEIRSKNLKALPDCIGSLKQLERLTLKCENLDALPNSIGSLKQMQQLELNCANLEALPDSIGELGNIYSFKIESASLKALPNSIVSLGRIHYLHLRCMSLDSIPDYVGGLKELYCFEVMSNSLKVLPQSIGSLKSIRTLILNCPNLEILYDSIGELKGLSHFEVVSHVLEYLPHSIGSITGIQSLSLRCVNLEALPDSMETLESLDFLELHCDNFTAPPDFIGRLENLESFSFKSKNLKYLHATIDESLGRLNTLSLSGCENLEVLVAASIQQTGLSRLSSLESLHLDNCKKLQCIPQLPSSLLLLDASGCTNLTTISDVSDLKNLEKLILGGCKLLEDVCGLENISSNLKTLEMPGPCDFIECCHLSHEFRNKVFKEMTFDSLRRFKMSGSLVRGSATGQQQLHFMLPRLRFSWLRRARLTLGLDQVLSPMHVVIMADNSLVFEKIVRCADEVELNLREESMVKSGKGEGEHCYTVQVTTEASQLQNVWAVLEHRSGWY
ncbi:disease resistance protein RPV1-like isoform X2 [Nymphaea colorata]|uniref:disease resistance protein RPV1-like isoform X2 n=1 Tax=Nymphaea colorata TaxID=210225 RepID=UPI00129EC54A|nr:disease resistance protein RPV1-like isoform X2 [Nymphaea colorata]